MNFGFFFNIFFSGIFMVFIGGVVFVVHRLHFLLSLLSLEMMVLGFFMILIGFVMKSSEGYLVFVVLSLASCEAAVGLSLLVSLIRSHGSDFISILSVYEC